MKSRIRIFAFLVCAALAAAVAARPAAGEEDAPAAESRVADAPIAPFRIELLELAFETASAFPIYPHIKNRSLAQEEVVEACFKLDQPLRALRYVRRIEGWRRGAGFADYAFYCARHGAAAEAELFCGRAREIAEAHNDEDAQAWERDRIRVKIAATYAVLGQGDKSAALGAGVEDSEYGKVETVRAALIDGDGFDDYFRWLEEVFEIGQFDRTRNALEAAARLFGRFYDDGERREKVEAKIKSSYGRLPVMVRIETLLKLAEVALDHDDPGKALGLAAEARALLDQGNWLAEHRVPMMARLAALRHRAGEHKEAAAEAAAALAVYDAKRDATVDMYRAGALRPLAEAYHAMGDSEAALKTYKRAVEEGVGNPNSRPRAVDLARTCCSMAVHGVEPDEKLWSRMREIYKELGEPW